jgi:hypothetical protein
VAERTHEGASGPQAAPDGPADDPAAAGEDGGSQDADRLETRGTSVGTETSGEGGTGGTDGTTVGDGTDGTSAGDAGPATGGQAATAGQPATAKRYIRPTIVGGEPGGTDRDQAEMTAFTDAVIKLTDEVEKARPAADKLGTPQRQLVGDAIMNAHRSGRPMPTAEAVIAAIDMTERFLADRGLLDEDEDEGWDS